MIYRVSINLMSKLICTCGPRYIHPRLLQFENILWLEHTWNNIKKAIKGTSFSPYVGCVCRFFLFFLFRI